MATVGGKTETNGDLTQARSHQAGLCSGRHQSEFMNNEGLWSELRNILLYIRATIHIYITVQHSGSDLLKNYCLVYHLNGFFVFSKKHFLTGI